MKKKSIIILIISILLIISGLVFFYLLGNSKMKQITNNEIKKLMSITSDMQKEIDKYHYSNMGTMNVNAIYKGAHGEHYPKEFTYNFIYENNILSLENNSTYFDKEINVNNLYDLINKIDIKSYINKDTRKIKFRSVQYKLDITNINKDLNKNFTSGNIEFNYSGLVPSLDNYVITLDNIKITKSGSDFNIVNGNNKIKLTISNNSYSLNINDYLKANYIVKDDIANIAIVLDNDAYTLRLGNNDIYFKANGPHAIYNGLEVTLNFENIELNKKVLDEEINIPIYRYFSDTNYQLWR